MKKRVFVTFVATSLMATSALADSVFMLQFGSFESQTEAQSHLNDLKGKHPDLIGSLPTSIRSVSLPPDNLTVFRTQAGPLQTRAQAQQVCSQFAASGDECYVVESAMVAQGAPVGTQSVNAPSAPDMAAAPATPAAPLPSTAALSSQEMAPAPATASPQPMESELTAAAANQQSTQQSIASASTQPSIPHSIWWHMNPFSKAPSAPDAVPAATAAAAPVAAPVEPVTATNDTRQPVMEHLNPFSGSSSTTTTVTPPPAPNGGLTSGTTPPALPTYTTTTTTAVTPAVTYAPSAPQPMAANEVPPSMMHLPPPPPPLRGETIPTMAPAAGAPPVPTGAMPPAPPPPPPGGPMAMQPAPGNVRVGEAQRVPLSQQNVPPAAPAMIASVPAPTSLPKTQPPVSLYPSSTIGQKTLWAQIGTFHDAQAALSYWDGYRQSHPDFPVVRVRVTTPYQSQQRGYTQVTLRVGPFARPEFVRNLCGTIPSSANLQCVVATDLGMAANPFGPNSGYLQDSRYHR